MARLWEREFKNNPSINIPDTASVPVSSLPIPPEGLMSPYPSVVIVTTLKYKESEKHSCDIFSPCV